MSRTKAPTPSRAKPTESASKSGFESWFTPGKLLLLLFGLMLVTFPDIFFQGKVFSYRDAGLFNYPCAYFVRESWLAGEAPLWNPYNNCGIPFLAQWNVMGLYPLSAIYVFLPVPWSITAFSLAHFFIAAAGMYFLALRWTDNRFAASVAGLAFAWNGITLHSLMWPNSCASIAWMPWVILLVEKALKQGGRNVLLAGLVGGLQMLAGVPEIILLTWVIAAGLSLVLLREEKHQLGKVFLRGISIGLLVIGLTAAQMLPFFDLLQHSHRSGGLKTETWAMPAWGLANYLVPLFRSSPDDLGVYTQDEQQWSSSYYMGIVVVALAALAFRQLRQPRVLLLLILVVIGSLFALGEKALVYGWVKKAIPFLGIMRYPAKWTQLAMFCLPLLAAFGIAWLQNRSADASSAARRKLIIVGAVILTLIGIILAVAYLRPREDEPWQTAWKNGLLRLGLLTVCLVTIANLLSKNPLFSQRTMALIILAILGLDISLHMPRQVRTTPIKEWKAFDYQMSEIPKLGESRAMLSAPANSILRKASMRDPIADLRFKRGSMHMTANLLDRVPKVNGLFSLYVKEAAEVDGEIYNKGQYSDGLFDFLGASQMSAPDQVTRWMPRPDALPLATVGIKPVFLEQGEALVRIFSPRFNPGKNVYLPKEAEGAITAKDSVPEASVTQREFTARQIVYDVQTPKACILTLAQTFYHPWKAEVDGKETTIWRANHAYQAIEVPAGEHTIEFTYQDEMFRKGSYISVATLLLGIGAWFWLGRRRGTTT